MVLIVEDDATFRHIIKDTLYSRFPFLRISEAGDGVQAFREINASVPDFIFMDLRLPGENGLVLTKKIREKYPEVGIAILTAYDQPEYRESAVRNGARYYLLKGTTTPEEVVSVVEDSLFRRGNGGQNTTP